MTEAPAGRSQEAGDPAAAVARHRAALIAQCPVPLPPPSAEEASKLPINVVHWGGTGPKVLVVHGGVQGGLGGGPRTFARQEALAERGWQLVVVERPGFGRSPSRGLDDMEADSIWIADMLGDGMHLIGHSWGGADALLAAARRPESVRSLTLIEPALQALLLGDPRVKTDPAIRSASAHIMTMMMNAKTPGEYGMTFAKSMGAETEGGAPNAVAAAYQADPEQAERVGCALLMARMAAPDVLRRAAAVVAQARFPVLVVSGGWSPFFDAVGDVAAELTGGRHVKVEAPNHFVQLSSPERFNTLVDTFMREAEQGRTKAD